MGDLSIFMHLCDMNTAFYVTKVKEIASDCTVMPTSLSITCHFYRSLTKACIMT